MKLLDPLSGYRVTSQISFFQLGFSIAMCYLAYQDEFDPDDRDWSILFLLLSHLSFAIIDYGRVFMQRFKKISILLSGTLNFVTTAVYQVIIFYAQVKYLNSEINDENFSNHEEFEIKEERALNWLIIEIAVYYFQIALTIFFLFLQIFFKLEVKEDDGQDSGSQNLLRTSKPPVRPSKIVKPADQIELLQQHDDSYRGGKDENFSMEYDNFWSDLRQNQDFLSLVNDQLQQFLFFGIIFTVSIFVIVIEATDGYFNTEIFSYFYPVLVLTILVGILFFYTIIDQFTKYQESPCMKKYFYKVIIVLIFIDLAYMVFDLFMVGIDENVERYWIITVICIAISYLFTEIFVKLIESRSSENYLKKQKVINFDETKNKKITLNHPGSNFVDMDDDIYAITFFAFEILDKRKKDEVDQSNQSFQSDAKESFGEGGPQIQQLHQEQSDMVHRAAITYVDASKNFSTCVVIFMIQIGLIALMYQQLKVYDKKVELLFSVFLTRILCSFVLHMRLQSEIYKSIQMFNYARLMVHYKDNRMTMLLIASMQLVGSFLTEFINIYLICAQNSVLDILINYIALGVIAEIDNIYAKSLEHHPLRIMIDKGVTLTFDENKAVRPGYNSNKSIAKIFYLVVKVFYESYYYYFMTFTVVGLTFFFIMF
eukprot:403360793